MTNTTLLQYAKKTGTLALAILAVSAGSAAIAGENPGWYGGLNIGESAATIDDARIVAGLLAGGFTTTTISDEDRDTGGKLFAGYQFNKHFAVEGGYFDLGKFGFLATTVPAGALSGELKASGLNVDAVGIWPFTEKFSAFGRVGLTYVDVQDSFAGTGSVSVIAPGIDKQAADYKFGVGLEYAFTENIGLRAEAERYRLDDAVGNMSDIDMLSLGIVVRYGGSESSKQNDDAPAATSAPAATPVAAAEPARVVVPVKTKKEKYCSILDLTFEIDNGSMQRDDLEKLSVLGTYMNKYPETTALVEGHSDSDGEPAHNLQLSLQRAQNAVAYLVNTAKIDASRLSAIGYGASRPVADNNTEAGKRANRRIDVVIACVTDVAGLTVQPARTTMALEMEFDPRSNTVRPEYRDELIHVANYLKANPTVTATVEGHAGKFLGSEEIAAADSLTVSGQRADAVVNYLAGLGVARSRLSATAYGQSRRTSYGTTLEGQQENRRVNIVIVYPKQ